MLNSAVLTTGRCLVASLVNIAAAFSLEPLARIPAGRAIEFRAVWIAEVAVGLAMMLYVASEARSAQTHARRDAT